MGLKYSFKTDIGRVRPHNEDAVKIFSNSNFTLMVVADGMGGHALGDVASKMAIDHIEGQLGTDLLFNSKEEVSIWLNTTLEKINNDILTYAISHNAKNMGTTLVLSIITGSFAVFANIGDSRAYLLAYDNLRQITKDHTFVRELVAKGQISERAAKLHPRKNALNKALGVSKRLEFDIITLENYEIDAILLCTDGLTGLIEDQEILAVLKTSIDIDEKVSCLIEKANVRGGRDNISIALVEFEKGVG